MAVETVPSTAAVCPPHYWLIEKQGVRTQHWRCRRCGVEKDLQNSRKLRYRWVSQGPNPRTSTPPQDRAPQSGTAMATVLDCLRQGQSRQEIQASTGLPRQTVAYTICNLRRDGYYDQSLKERVNQWREAVSLGRGGIWPVVREYAHLHMSPTEIREAILFRKQRGLSAQQINAALNKARRRGDLDTRTTEERLDIGKDGKRPTEDIRARVELWLEITDLLRAHRLDTIPQRRADWITLTKFLYDRKRILHESTITRDLFNDVFDSSYSAMAHLKPCFDTIEAITKTRRTDGAAMVSDQ